MTLLHLFKGVLRDSLTPKIGIGSNFGMSQLEQIPFQNDLYLVGGLEHFSFFHNIWDNPSH
jgi:hypothetical protein